MEALVLVVGSIFFMFVAPFLIEELIFGKIITGFMGVILLLEIWFVEYIILRSLIFLKEKFVVYLY